MKFAKTALLAAAMLASFPFASAGAWQAKDPDIMGVWEMYPDPYADDANTFMELIVPGDGPKLKEPYATEWKAQRAKRTAMVEAGTPLPDSSTLCMPEGVPMIMLAIFPLQILQTPGQITVLGEFLTQTRRIYLNEPMPPLEDITPGYYGTSVARWEGDTLVVTTKGVQKETKFFEIPHSEEMTVTERIRLTGPDLLENQVTIEDPQMLVEPYRFTFGYKRNKEYRISEYFCEREDPLLKVGKDGTVQMKTVEEVK